MERVSIAQNSKYNCYFYQTITGFCNTTLVNASHIKAVPGRKTDIKDAQWIAELLQHGLLKASFQNCITSTGFVPLPD